MFSLQRRIQFLDISTAYYHTLLQCVQRELLEITLKTEKSRLKNIYVHNKMKTNRNKTVVSFFFFYFTVSRILVPIYQVLSPSFSQPVDHQRITKVMFSKCSIFLKTSQATFPHEFWFFLKETSLAISGILLVVILLRF